MCNIFVAFYCDKKKTTSELYKNCFICFGFFLLENAKEGRKQGQEKNIRQKKTNEQKNEKRKTKKGIEKEQRGNEKKVEWGMCGFLSLHQRQKKKGIVFFFLNDRKQTRKARKGVGAW